MNIKQANIICFSPATHTRKVCDHIKEVSTIPTNVYDITAYHDHCPASFAHDELVLFAIPSFGGRVPEIALQKLTCIGHNTPCVLIVTYGNRAYDDTLLELKEHVEAQGFVSIGAAALICEHSIMHVFGTDRPNQQDLASLTSFIEQLVDKLSQDAPSSIQVKGKHPYKEYSGIPLKPKATASCTSCGACATHCPVQAIDPLHPKDTNKDICISCMSCVAICPSQDREVNAMMVKASILKMKKACSDPKQNEFIL